MTLKSEKTFSKLGIFSSTSIRLRFDQIDHGITDGDYERICDPSLRILQDFGEEKIDIGDQIVVRGTRYLVDEVIPDGENAVLLKLKQVKDENRN